MCMCKMRKMIYSLAGQLEVDVWGGSYMCACIIEFVYVCVYIVYNFVIVRRHDLL